jgi:hypothetical protein
MGLVDLSYGPFGHPSYGPFGHPSYGPSDYHLNNSATSGVHHSAGVTPECTSPALLARGPEPRLGCDLNQSGTPGTRSRRDTAPANRAVSDGVPLRYGAPNKAAGRKRRPPHLARNTGSGEPLSTATKLVAADQQVFHDPLHPSAVVLTVLD